MWRTAKTSAKLRQSRDSLSDFFRLTTSVEGAIDLQHDDAAINHHHGLFHFNILPSQAERPSR